ncbi:hypothetical protein RSAG8_13047, partial [Rhizoctonia solani AG-8 WAC10335]
MSAVKLINAVLDMKTGFRTADFISPRRKSLIRPPRRLDTRIEWEIWTVSEVTSKLKWRAVRYPGGTTQAIILPSSTDRVAIRELIYIGLHHTSSPPFELVQNTLSSLLWQNERCWLHPLVLDEAWFLITLVFETIIAH